MKKQTSDRYAFLLATWFYAGRFPKAPGTMGSLCALPLAYLATLGGVGGVLAVSLLVFWLGCWVTDVVVKKTHKQDPGFVVIDEVVGQTLTFVFVVNWAQLTPLVFLLGFVLFRFFDIVKIWPVSYFDKKVHSAFGVMMDDVIAGLYAAVVLYLICLYI